MGGFLRAAALAAVIWLVAAGSASAATEFGNDCTATAAEPGWTAVGLNSGERHVTLQETAGPFEWSAGRAVITRWKVNLGPGIGPLAQQLIVIRDAGEGLTNVGESAVETLAEGSNEFKTRIPITEYSRIGLRGPAATVFCDGVEDNLLGVVEGDFPPGQSRDYEVLFDKGGAAVAVAEADADGDGYGDETQDGCPRSAEFHDPCPYAEVTGRVEAIRRGAILIGVTTNVATRIQVAGQATWPDPYHRGGKRTVALSGGVQPLGANGSAVFRVPLPKVMIRKLNRTRPGKKVKAQLYLTRLDRLEELPGWVNKSLVVKLPGRDRKPPKR